jgi:hypothetical protein
MTVRPYGRPDAHLHISASNDFRFVVWVISSNGNHSKGIRFVHDPRKVLEGFGTQGELKTGRHGLLSPVSMRDNGVKMIFVSFLRAIFSAGGDGRCAELSLSKKGLLNFSNMTEARHFVFERLGVSIHNIQEGS